MDTKEPNILSNTSQHSIFFICTQSQSSHYHIIAFLVITVPVVLPLCLYILYLGVQQWRSRTRISHSDFFTYNIVVSELICILGSCFIILNRVFKQKLLIGAAMCLYLISSAAIIVFQIFTCLDRYTAVVHPVTYMNLKSPTWALVRNICSVFAWLVCIVESYIFLYFVNKKVYFAFSVQCFSCCLILVMYLNLRILHVLIHPGPGDGAKGSKTKQRAFYTISAITGTLMVKFLGDLLSLTSFTLLKLDLNISCALFLSSVWFTLPSTLVLPLLFMHRNHKMPCFKSK